MGEIRTEGIGFSTITRDASDIETEHGIKIDDRRTLGSLKAQGTKFLEIFFGSYTEFGIYRGTTDDGTHVIQPTPLPNGDAYFDRSKPHNERFVWTNSPSFQREEITGFRVVNRKTLEAAGSGFEKVAHLGEIIGEKSPPLNYQI